MIYDKHIQDLSNLILDYYPNSVPSDIQIQETRKDFIGDFRIFYQMVLERFQDTLPSFRMCSRCAFLKKKEIHYRILKKKNPK